MADAKVVHPLAPIVDEHCTKLILGSFPSVKSREAGFYYSHPQNRFWKVMAVLCGRPLPETNDEKRRMLLDHHIALWDSIHSCTIHGSSDSSIRDVIPNDIETLIQGTRITEIFCNGQSALKYFKKYQKKLDVEAKLLPSTSPANAQYSLEHLIAIWKAALRLY